MQISEKEGGRNISLLIFKLEILTLKQGSGFFFLEEIGIGIHGKSHFGVLEKGILSLSWCF